MKITELKEAFIAVFGNEVDATSFSPGRIDLTGEHTDCNGGHVFLVAITFEAYGAAHKRGDQIPCFYSTNSADLGVTKADLANLVFDKKDSWTNYPKGAIRFLQGAGHTIDIGFDLYVNGNIPSDPGLSSSASSELSVGIVAEELSNLNLNRPDLVKIGKQAEDEFIGVSLGTMDQFVISMGVDKQATYLDASIPGYDLVPPNLGGNVIVIININKRRELVGSRCNGRHVECEKAVEELNQMLDTKTPGELDLQAFDEYSYLIKDTNRFRRTYHVVWENQHTLQAKEALVVGELEKLGHLVNASHVPFGYDYKVAGIELDTLAYTVWQQRDVLGVRMTGAGLGDCGIAITAKDKVDEFTQNAGKVYTEIIDYAPASYIAEIVDGSRVLSRK